MNQMVRSFIHVRDDANYHMRAWNAWSSSQREDITPGDFLKAIAFLSGLTIEEIRKDDRSVHMTEIRIELVKAVKAKFPKMSACKLGSLFNRERTTICRILKSKPIEARRHTKLSSLDIPIIRRMYSKGSMNTRVIAEKFGVSHGTISAILRGETDRSVSG